MSPEDAQEAPPWRPELGPEPHRRHYDPRPMLLVRIDGHWRRCLVESRSDWANGHTAYHVEVTLPGTGTVYRTYWWHPQTMRPAL
ncbi:hypothetical protein [Streptomyces sp. NRRL F-5053]|uniref:hypothetical protein n=1 Tax=Streptomyces sp. NRRL F-5053 TaxID=1463854 RepID=UPI0004C9024D|nr:hypothetical protein [Streptomyces sp. NRRL F-5053]